MSKMVARMQKMKSGNLTGIGNHNQRKTENHSNKDIDISRSHLNYDLVNRTENYKTDIEKFINENKSTKRAVRKDAVLVNEWIITSDQNFFKDLSPEKTKAFFEKSKEYFAEQFGDENIRYAQVHLDETTPHMHLGVVPFDKDRKLSAKRVFGRTVLKDVQDDLPRFLQREGFTIQRGEKDSQRKNLSVPEYKNMKEELKQTNQELEQKKSEVLALTNNQSEKVNKKVLDLQHETKTVKVPSGETIGTGRFQYEFKKNEERKTGNVILPEKELDNILQRYADLYNANQQLKQYVETDLPKRNQELVSKYNNLAKEFNTNIDDYNNLLEKNKTLEKQVGSLKQEIKEIYLGIKGFFKERAQDLKHFKAGFNAMTNRIQENLSGSEFERTHKQDMKSERSRGGRSR